MVTNGIQCSDRASASSTVGGGELIGGGSCPEVLSEGGSNSPGDAVSVAVSASSSGNGGPPGQGGPSLLPVGLPFLPSLGPEPPFYSGHPGPGFDLKENIEAWRSIPTYAASIYGGYDGAILAGYPMLRNGYGMDLNGSRRKNATRETTSTLKAWLNDHRKNPYPTKAEKIMLAIITQMTLTQVSTWFANARRRLKKENKMTWSPRNRCDDDDDCKEGGFNSSTDTRDVDGTPLSSSVNKDTAEQDYVIDIDDHDDSSDNSMDKKRFKVNESPLPPHLECHPGLQHHHLHRTHPLLHPLSPQQLQLSSLSQLNHPLSHHHINHPLLHHHHSSSHHPLSLHHPPPFAPNGSSSPSSSSSTSSSPSSSTLTSSTTTTTPTTTTTTTTSTTSVSQNHHHHHVPNNQEIQNPKPRIWSIVDFVEVNQEQSTDNVLSDSVDKNDSC